MIEKYPLSWLVNSLGSLYALAISQSARATSPPRKQRAQIEGSAWVRIACLPASASFVTSLSLDRLRDWPGGVGPVGGLVLDVQVGGLDPLSARVAAGHDRVEDAGRQQGALDRVRRGSAASPARPTPLPRRSC